MNKRIIIFVAAIIGLAQAWHFPVYGQYYNVTEIGNEWEDVTLYGDEDGLYTYIRVGIANLGMADLGPPAQLSLLLKDPSGKDSTLEIDPGMMSLAITTPIGEPIYYNVRDSYIRACRYPQTCQTEMPIDITLVDLDIPCDNQEHETLWRFTIAGFTHIRKVTVIMHVVVHMN